ncbi:hypothetical protein EV666_1331 [Camelimonas lactis]|uniref:Uncharacterized protein n=1 Tax=Camelimonas lactis TaxID=659006 RepID=A0A4R2GGX3_9HYPH|nr:hypothetical protein EV666_1331 [Camelimonas lactis]
MVRILAQAILSAAGVVVALFVSRDAVGFPVYQMVGALFLIAALAVIVWYCVFHGMVGTDSTG